MRNPRRGEVEGLTAETLAPLCRGRRHHHSPWPLWRFIPRATPGRPDRVDGHRFTAQPGVCARPLPDALGRGPL